MPDTFEIMHELHNGRGRYHIALPDGDEAELTYALRAPDIMAADHTLVPPQWRGDGLALKLVERLVADARTEHLRILPLCSYVAAQFRRHPEWADLDAR